MEPGAAILCRLDSTRLPGKVLKPVQGIPLLGYVIARCQQSQRLAHRLVVATTTRSCDDPIVDYCQRLEIPVFRGSRDNVAQRMLECAIAHQWDYVFRINADSPFVDSALLDLACDQVVDGAYDLVTNLAPRSFPYGVSVELLKTTALEAAYDRMSEPSHYEHVTQFFYQNLAEFRYFNIAHDGEDLSGIRLTVDTADDFEQFERAIALAGEAAISLNYWEAVRLYQQIRTSQDSL